MIPDGRRVNRVRIDADGRTAIIDECTVCGEEHRHNGRDPALALRRSSYRVAHCEDNPDGYALILPSDADPPEAWRAWARGICGGW